MIKSFQVKKVEKGLRKVHLGSELMVRGVPLNPLGTPALYTNSYLVCNTVAQRAEDPATSPARYVLLLIPI